MQFVDVELVAGGGELGGDMRVKLMMSSPCAGPIVALNCVSAIDDPSRFTSSK
jgi:hypothetical protein